VQGKSNVKVFDARSQVSTTAQGGNWGTFDFWSIFTGGRACSYRGWGAVEEGSSGILVMR
jgi:hypothetical protein